MKFNIHICHPFLCLSLEDWYCQRFGPSKTVCSAASLTKIIDMSTLKENEILTCFPLEKSIIER